VLNTVACIQEGSLDRKLGSLDDPSKLAALPKISHLRVIVGVHGSSKFRQLVRSAVAAPVLLREP
jgi:hypothetical protein